MAGEPCNMYPVVKEGQENLGRTLSEQTKDINSLSDRVVRVEESTKSAHHRLDEQKDMTKAIIKMSASVEYMAEQMKEVVSSINIHDGRIQTLERAPGDAMISYKKNFWTALIAAIAGAIIASIA